MSQEANEIFQGVARRCGLAAMFAPGTVRRALQQAGIEPAAATVDDYFTILTALMQRISTYLGEQEAKERIREIRSYLKQVRLVGPILAEGASSRGGA
ncbi:MAG: hypothetical protein R3B09_13035 [Nannocystaceae bacterium]